jgi:protein-S-isoprenylcysteine O-methyltransferase Ste14
MSTAASSITKSMTESSVHGCAGTAAKASLTRPSARSASLGIPLPLRIAGFTYGVLCYAVFFVTFLYAFGFVGNFLTPTALDMLPSANAMHWSKALLVNLGLLTLFAVQHSVMARPWFKARWTRIVPESIERSTYVLCASAAMIAMFYFWQPIGGVIWHTADPILRGVVVTVMTLGWSLVFVSTWLINHFDLFGLRQVWFLLMDKPYTHLPFTTPLFYRFIRHPLYLGCIIGFWATPTMTAAHLVFAIATTIYILLAIRWEERDLLDLHGQKYRDYRSRVSKLIPSVV